MTKQELKDKIATYERQLSGSLPESIKAKIPAKIEKLKADLSELEKSEAKPEKKEEPVKKEKAPKKAKAEKKVRKKKVVKPVEPVKKERMVVKGKKELMPVAKKKDTPPAKAPKGKMTVKYGDKEYTEDDSDFCEVLIKSMKERKARMKKAAKKHKTVSISSKIGANVASAVEKAIESVNKNDIKDKPKVFIAKFERLEDSARKFLNDFKAILGSDYDSADIKADLENITKSVEKIKSNYNKKK